METRFKFGMRPITGCLNANDPYGDLIQPLFERWDPDSRVSQNGIKAFLAGVRLNRGGFTASGDSEGSIWESEGFERWNGHYYGAVAPLPSCSTQSRSSVS